MFSETVSRNNDTMICAEEEFDDPYDKMDIKDCVDIREENLLQLNAGGIENN